MSKRIVVIGGSGFIGRQLVYALSSAGYRVTVPTRRRSKVRELLTLPMVDVLEANIHQQEQLNRLIADADAVINLVGVLHDKQQSPYGPAFKQAHVELPAKIIKACEHNGVQRLLHMSALGADRNGPSMYQRSKFEGQALVMNSALQWTVFAPSVVFGHEDKFMNTFAQLSKFAPILAVGGSKSKLQPVYVGDVVQAFMAALANPTTIGKAYTLVGPRAYTLGDLVRLAGRLSGHPRLVLHLPEPFATLQAFSLELMPIKLMSRDNLQSLKVDNISNQPIAPELGVIPTPLEAVAQEYLQGQGPRSHLNNLRKHTMR